MNSQQSAAEPKKTEAQPTASKTEEVDGQQANQQDRIDQAYPASMADGSNQNDDQKQNNYSEEKVGASDPLYSSFSGADDKTKINVPLANASAAAIETDKYFEADDILKDGQVNIMPVEDQGDDEDGEQHNR